MAFNRHLVQTSNPWEQIAQVLVKVFNKCLLNERVSEWMVRYNHSRVGLERDLRDHLIQPACLTAEVQSREVTRPSTHIRLLLESSVETLGSHLPCHHLSYYISPPANVIFYLLHLRSHLSLLMVLVANKLISFCSQEVHVFHIYLQEVFFLWGAGVSRIDSEPQRMARGKLQIMRAGGILRPWLDEPCWF